MKTDSIFMIIRVSNLCIVWIDTQQFNLINKWIKFRLPPPESSVKLILVITRKTNILSCGVQFLDLQSSDHIKCNTLGRTVSNLKHQDLLICKLNKLPSRWYGCIFHIAHSLQDYITTVWGKDIQLYVSKQAFEKIKCLLFWHLEQILWIKNNCRLQQRRG